MDRHYIFDGHDVVDITDEYRMVEFALRGLDVEGLIAQAWNDLGPGCTMFEFIDRFIELAEASDLC